MNHISYDTTFVRNSLAARDTRIVGLEYENYCLRQMMGNLNNDIQQLRQRVLDLEMPFVAPPFQEHRRQVPLQDPVYAPAPAPAPAPALYVHRVDGAVVPTPVATTPVPIVRPVDVPEPIAHGDVPGDVPDDMSNDAVELVEPVATVTATRRSRTASKLMKDYFLDEDIVRHTIPSLNSTWEGVYNAETETIYHAGIEYTSLSRFTKSHYMTALNNPATTRGGNGWKECVIVRNGVETLAHEVPTI